MFTSDSASPLPRTTPDLEAINAHLSIPAHTQRCPRCTSAAGPLMAGVTGLLAGLTRLCEELAALRLDNANLRAAIQAALGAAGDGEPDPLDYLRWELPEHQNLAPNSARGRR